MRRKFFGELLAVDRRSVNAGCEDTSFVATLCPPARCEVSDHVVVSKQEPVANFGRTLFCLIDRDIAIV
jgi:hypothetical protein